MATQQKLSADQLATKIVGDGKSPNLYFVTLSFGWKYENYEEEPTQAKNSLQSVTMGPFTSKQKAMETFNSITLNATEKITGQTLSGVMMEDRQYGVLMEKYLKRHFGLYFPVEIEG
jgi:hypothetical protein